MPITLYPGFSGVADTLSPAQGVSDHWSFNFNTTEDYTESSPGGWNFVVNGATLTVTVPLSAAHASGHVIIGGTDVALDEDITIGDPPSPPVITIISSPTVTIDKGGSTTIVVTSTGGTNTTINDGTGAVDMPDGTATVHPRDTTVYTVTVTGAGGSTAVTITVTVTDPCLCAAWQPEATVTAIFTPEGCG